MSKNKILIDQVRPGSIADELGIEPGDVLLTINGQQPQDLIDYRFMCADDRLEIEVLKNDNEIWACDVEKEYDEDLGLGFTGDAFGSIRRCVNKCIFCFVDQMPPGMRSSLYIKDDDYRMSFLHGNFVTLTNLTEKDLSRIIRMRLSPLYISVHCTNPDLRVKMLGNKKAAKIMSQLKTLAEAGIEMHTQIVLSPGINDGRELDRSIVELAGLWPQVKSIAIVPVGLTGYRSQLFELRRYSPAEAEKLIEKVHSYQQEFIRKFEIPVVYLADEFYVMAQQAFPAAEFYGEYPQLENGVGLVRLFYDSFAEKQADLPDALEKELKVALVTGVSGKYILKPVVERLNKIDKLHTEPVAVENKFFGGHVSVAGLLTGRDVINKLREKPGFALILLPSVMCKRDEQVFLDGKTPGDIEKELGVPVVVVNLEEGAEDLVKVIASAGKGGAFCG